MDGTLDPILARNFAIALAIGALVGIEREKKKALEGYAGTGGIRTFILFAEAGAVSAWVSQQLGSPWVFVATVAVVGLFVAMGFVAQTRVRPTDLGLTTEVAAVVVCLLGGATMFGHLEVAVGLAIVTSAVLTYKQPLHGIVEKIGVDDLYAGVTLLIASFIVLPLLPDRPLEPGEPVPEWVRVAFSALNPYRLWLLVILISGLSLIGYVAVRWLGRVQGTALTGLLGGLVSSTAVTLAFARASRQEGDERRGGDLLACGILLAWAVMFVRVGVEVAVVCPPLLLPLGVPLGAMGTAVLAVAGLHYWRGRGEAGQAEVPLANPFNLWSACKFALFFAAVLLLVKLARTYLPAEGLYLVAGLAGLTDVDAITLSMAELACGGGEPRAAATAIVIAALSNTLVKCGMAALLGSALLCRHILVATAILLATGAVALMLKSS